MSIERPQDLVERSGRRGDPRRLDQMVSARLSPDMAVALKEFAAAHGMSLSQVFREAAAQFLAATPPAPPSSPSPPMG
jgi:hypothetical protein